MIYIDTRESPAEVHELLDMMGTSYELGMLKVGDYIVTGENGMVVIERKEAKDYVGSLIGDAHLNNQLVNQSHLFKHSVVVVIGSINNAIDESGVSRKAVYSSLQGTYLRKTTTGEEGNISLVMIENNFDLALLLDRCQHKLDDPEGLIRLPKIAVPHVTDGDPRVKMLMCISGIGEGTAREILKIKHSIEDIVRSSPEELAKAKGVGLRTANKIIEHMTISGFTPKER